jgi:hypothetical protein
MKSGAIACVLFVLGVAVNLTFGRRGFLPLDQSVVFDGGWRLLSGQVPFRDFAAPSGLVPAAMQAPVFGLLGTTWFAYCLHASIVNGLASICVFALLHLCGATRLEAAGFAALTAFFFYPPTGTPFMDQHSFFFMTAMFTAVAAGTVASGRAEVVWWTSVPTLFVLGYLSGQIPMSFGAVAVAIWVACQPTRAPRRLLALTAGTAIAAALLFLVHLFRPFDLSSAIEYSILMPLKVAGRRTVRPGVGGPLRMIAATLVNVPRWSNMWSLDAALVAALPLALASRSSNRRPVQLWMFLSCTLVTAAFLAYTRTLLQTGLGLAMVIVALAAVFARQALPRRAAMVAVALLVAAAVRDTVVFVRDVDGPRLWHVEYDPQAAARAEGHLPPGLEFMRWSRGPSSYDADEMTALVSFLQGAEGNFVLIGDSSILYGLTGRRSIPPVLWFDPGLTIPEPRTADFGKFEAVLIERMRRDGVRRIVLERPRSWTWLTFEDFPRLVAWTKAGACGEKRFGAARVLELCADDPSPSTSVARAAGRSIGT